MSKEYPKELYCERCEKKTNHRPKLAAVLAGYLVCNVCDKMNKINQNKDEYN
jgi:hypothetical protein